MVVVGNDRANEKEWGSSLQYYFGKAVRKPKYKVGVFLIFKPPKGQWLIG